MRSAKVISQRLSKSSFLRVGRRGTLATDDLDPPGLVPGRQGGVELLFQLPLRDTQTGLKLFRREVLKKVFPKVLVKRYAFDLELLVLAHHCGFSIAESPVIVEYRGKFGHIGLRSVFNIWWDTMAIFYRLHLKMHYDH